MNSPEVTEEIGEELEGKVLQAVAGEGNWYVMVIMEIDEETDTLRLRVPSNLPDNSAMEALLSKAVGAL